MLRLSHSAMQNYHSCRMLYRLQNIQRIRRKGVIIPLITGRAVHACKEAMNQGLTVEQQEAALLREFDLSDTDLALVKREDRVKLDIEKHRAVAMMRAYRDAYSAVDATQYVNYITESHIEMPLMDGVVYHGYIDCLAKDASGDWWIFETKTAASGTVNANFFERVKIDSQVSGYMELAKVKLGHYPKGIVYDVIIKTKHSQRKGESHTAFVNRLTHLYVNEWKTAGLFERHELEVMPSTVARWRRDCLLVAGEIKAAMDSKQKTWPRNTGQCLGKFGACAMMNICVTGRMNKLLYEKRKS